MFKRIFTSILILSLVLVMPSSAFAANENFSTTIHTVEFSNGDTIVNVPNFTPYSGSETWNKDGAVVGTFTMSGNNVTPVKIIGKNYEGIAVNVDKFESSKPVILTVAIRKAYTKTVLGWEGKSKAAKSGSNISAGYRCTKGDQIQIYFRVTDANGNYDPNLKCKITYSYSYWGTDTN